MIRASLALGLLPSEFLSRATAWDLTVLQAYDGKYLLGDLHDDFRTGLWCQTYVNSKLKPSASPVRITDFMPLLDESSKRPPKQSLATMAAMLKAWAKANGAVIPPPR